VNSEEEWREVPGLRGYSASSLGRIKGPHGRIIGSLDKDGYLRVTLTREGRRRCIGAHAMVALAFIGPRPDGYDIDHIDGARGNNAPSNLQYCSHSKNMAKAQAPKGANHPQARLTDAQIADVRSSTETHRVIAKRVGISVGYVSLLRNDKRRKISTLIAV
jgi:hypothetical protein